MKTNDELNETQAGVGGEAGQQAGKPAGERIRPAGLLARWPAFLVACFGIMAAVLVPLAILYAADITPGYTFTSGEKNVTHTKLNNSASGTINTTFYSGKSSAGADPNTAWTILLHDTSSDEFKKSTLQAAVFDHTSLFSARSAKLAPVVADTVLITDSAAGGAYKQMSWTNWFFSGAATGVPTNETIFPTTFGGLAGSVTLSNLYGKATAHTTPTNGDRILLLSANEGRGIRGMDLEQLLKGQAVETQNRGSNSFLMWGENGLRQVRETNLIESLTLAAPSTNATLAFLENGALNKTTLQGLLTLIQATTLNMVQSTYTNTTNFTFTGVSGTWSNVTTIGGNTLSNAITPRFTTSRVLVRVILTACSQGGSDNGYMRVLRNGTAIGVGADDGANRVEAGASISNLSDPGCTVWEWLDSPATTSATGYNVQVSGVSGNTVFINRDNADANSTANGRFVSTLTLTEILQ